MAEFGLLMALTIIIYIKTDYTNAATTAATPAANGTLECYDCSETFKHTWEPYTECQYYPTTAPLRTCLDEERYCMVERVTYRSMTVSVARGCTQECLHGCSASGFGLTKLTCISCCLEPGCNTGDRASHNSVNVILLTFAVFTCALVTGF